MADSPDDAREDAKAQREKQIEALVQKGKNGIEPLPDID